MPRTFVMTDTPDVWLGVAKWADNHNLKNNKENGYLTASAVYKGEVQYEKISAYYVHIYDDTLMVEFKLHFANSIIYDRA